MDKSTTGQREAAWFFVRDRGRFWKIRHEEVLFIEARKSYCHIQTFEKPWLILTLLGNFEAVLPADEFLRVHRSYIINLRHLQSFDHRTAYLPGHEIPIGESYRTVVREHVVMVMPPMASGPVLAAG
jgi:DNA-binding LytR/AlgR family response regulator